MIASDLHSLYSQHLSQRVDHCHQALTGTEFDTLVIDSGGLNARFLDDTSYPFRVNPYSARLAPLQGFPESAIVIKQGAVKPILFIYRPNDFWHAHTELACEAITHQFEVEFFSQIKDLRAKLPNNSAVAYIGERTELLDQATTNPRQILNFLDYQQAIKTEYEVECIARANQKAAKGHNVVAELAQQPTSEVDLHLAYMAAIGGSESDLPYDSIIAADQNASVLHYTLRQSNFAPLKSLLIDAGATYQGYCSDISRTYCNLSSNGLPIFKSLIEELDQIQRVICAAVAPGINYLELHKMTDRSISKLLVDSEILTCSLEQALELNLGRVFFPHGVGHLLGVQVHDRGGLQADSRGTPSPAPTSYPHLRLTRMIETNQVFTIEPGLYFIDQLLNEAKEDGKGANINWQLVEELKPMGGIRIEDNLRVTADGSENLTRKAFAQLENH